MYKHIFKSSPSPPITSLRLDVHLCASRPHSGKDYVQIIATPQSAPPFALIDTRMRAGKYLDFSFGAKDGRIDLIPGIEGIYKRET
jgi:hypothetical protein